jgi:hypothetical protein
MALDFEKINKLSKLLKEGKYTSKEYKDTYKSIAPKGEIVKQILDDTFESSPLEEVTVRPSNYDKGERFGRKVINSTNETGKQMAPILGGMMIAPFAIGATASIAPSIGSYLSNPVITNSLNASNNFGRITNGVIGSNGVNQALGALGRSALGGMAIDTGYEAITGKPAQLGEALDVKNPVLRFGANMVSPGMFAGASSGVTRNIPQIDILNDVVDKVPLLRNGYFKLQDRSALKGVKAILKNFNGSEKLDNSQPFFNTQKLILNENIKNRGTKIGLGEYSENTFPPMGAISGDLNRWNTLKIFLNDNKRYSKSVPAKLSTVKNNSRFNNADNGTSFILNTTSTNGVYTPVDDYDIIGINRYKNGKLRTLKDIKGTAAHEGTHMMQNLFNINLNDDFANINPSMSISKDLKELLYQGSDWSKLPKELHSNLWRFREENKIGTRDLTDEEAYKFIEQYGNRHFNSDINIPKAVEVIKLLPSVGGLTILNNFNNDNK